jgi:hypothetical protein
VFGAGAGTRAYGARKPVIPAATQGTLTGAAFEVPVAGRLAKAATVGGLTTGIDVVSGQPLGEAAKSGIVNAAFAGLGGGGKRGERQTEATNRAVNSTPQAAEAEVPVLTETGARDIPVQPERDVRSVPVEQPQRFQHLQFGEIEVVPDQTGARAGKIKVAEVDDPTKQHFVKKADLQGRGNSQMIPVRQEPAEVPPQETAIPSPRNLPEPEVAQEVVPEAASQPESVEPSVDKIAQKEPIALQATSVNQNVENEIVKRVTENTGGPEGLHGVYTDEGLARVLGLPEGQSIQRLVDDGYVVHTSDGLEFSDSLKSRVKVVQPSPSVAKPAPIEPAKEAEVVKPWEMTREQVEQEFQRKKAEDDNLEASILGPELAKKYARLQRSANSSYDTEKANRASDEIEKIEASLSERDRNRLYGIGETGLQVDEWRDYQRSLSNLDDSDPQSLAESMRWAVSRVGNETDPLKMSHEQQVAYGTLREAARIAHENGWDTQAISREAVKAAAGRYSDPEDAKFMLDRFLKKETAPATPQPKQIAPSPQAEAVKPETSGEAGKEPSTPPTESLSPTQERTALQRASDEAKAKLDALGPEPPKPSSESRAFGSQGKEAARAKYPEQVARWEAETKAYNTWRRKYGPLKKAEVEASNAAFRERSREIITPAQDTNVGQNAAGEQLYERSDGSRYRMYRGRPDFGGDLAPIEQPSSGKVASPTTLTAEKSLAPEPESVSKQVKPSATKGEPNVVEKAVAPEIPKTTSLSKGKGGGTPETEIPPEPSFVRAARERKAKRAAEKAQGIEYRRAGADPYELVDDIIIRGHELYTEKVKPTFDEWKAKLRDEFGPAADRHAKGIWSQLSGEKQTSETAPKDKSMQADRESLGLPALEQVPHVSSEEVLAKAQEANKADPRAPDTLVEQALRGGKNFNNVETMQVNLRAVEVKNDIDRLNRELYDATDPQTIAEKSAELDARLAEYDKISEADDLAGAEWSRAGTARKRALAEDFSLVKMVAGLKKDKRAPLTEKQLEEVKDLHARLGKAEKERDAAEERAIKAEFQRKVDKVSRQRTRSDTREALDKEVVVIRQNILAEIARIKSGNIHASGLAGIDPEGRLTKELIKYVHNRAKANIGLKAEALIDEAHDLVKDLGVSRRQVAEALVGYGGTAKQRSEVQNRTAQVNAEINKLLKEQDVQAGRRSTRQEGPKPEYTKNQTRLKQLEKEKAELERRMVEGDFSQTKREGPRYTRETYAAQKEVEKIKAQYNRMRYKATRGRGGMISDELAKAANVPKLIKSMGDVSAVMRQGGFYAVSHPVRGLAMPLRDMVKSFSETGYANVEHAIKSHPKFEQARKDGVEFTGVDKNDPNLSKHEEGYLGKEYLDYVPIAKQIAGFSERTFVSFLDSQRMNMYDVMTEGLTNPSSISRMLGAKRGLSASELSANRQRIAKAINSGTGRGNLGRRGNQAAPLLNVVMFSPRLLKSRVELLNNMLNPVAIARMPRNARAQIIQDNVKFLAATVAVMQLARMSGGKVNLDPDDGDFLKIRFGDTTYDNLTGLQQPFRYIMNMARAATGGETYAGKDMWEQTVGTKTRGGFLESKASPIVGATIESMRGTDFLGRERTKTQRALDLVTPLPAKDVIEAFRREGLLGAIKATPTFAGVGVNTYPEPAEKATTQAEKLARKFGYHGDEAQTQEEIDASKERSVLRARSRKGEDVSADIAALGAKITPRQAKGILGARNKTRLQEDFNHLGPKEAVIVYGVASPAQQTELREMLQKKSALIDLMPPDQQDEVRKRFEALGMQRGTLPRQRQERQERTERKPREKQGYVFQ